MKEVIQALESITNINIIENFIKRQDINGCSILISVLQYTNSETEKLWLGVYKDVFKY
jgi:hypothetical protein